jgi:hypothetical protein
LLQGKVISCKAVQQLEDATLEFEADSDIRLDILCKKLLI